MSSSANPAIFALVAPFLWADKNAFCAVETFYRAVYFCSC